MRWQARARRGVSWPPIVWISGVTRSRDATAFCPGYRGWMEGVYSVVVLVAGGLWVVACVAFLAGWRVTRRERPSRGRAVLIALADEFLMVSRQAERSASALRDPSVASEPSASGEEFAKYHKQAAILFELLRAYLAEDSSSLRHAEAIVVDLTGLGGRSGFDHRMVGHRSSLAFHRTMLASVIWEDVDHATLKRAATPAPAVVRRPHHAGHRQLRHR
jgi:hypothetical protein